MNRRHKSPRRFVIGIDEVGRGCLAGPVTVAAIYVPRNLRSYIPNLKTFGIPLRDSKKLNPKQREKWLAYFSANPQIIFAYAHVSPRIIDRVNISQAANRAAALAVRKLAHNFNVPVARCTAYLDGGLYLDKKFCTLDGISILPRRAITMIKADENIPAVAMASIVAKVKRDLLMTRLAEKYPVYGFEIHKGYGTKRHRAAIQQYGISKIHRRSFAH